MYEKKLRSLKQIAMSLGVIGSAVLLCSLLMNCCSFTDSPAGKTTISMLDYIDVKIVVVSALIGMSCVFSLWSFAVSQILVGTFIGLWAGFMCWDIKIRAAEVAGYVGARLGLGVYMFILSACFILVSGILFAFFETNCKVLGIDDGKPRMIRKAEIFSIVAMAFSIVFSCVVGALKIIR